MIELSMRTEQILAGLLVIVSLGCAELCFGQNAVNTFSVEQLRTLKSRDEFDSLEIITRRMLKDLPPDPGPLRYDAEYYLAFALGMKDDPRGATDHAQQAYLIARSLADTTRMLESLYQLTKLNVEGRHYGEADHHRRDHLGLARRYGKDTTQLVLALNSIGSMHSRQEVRDSAVYYYREGLRMLGDRQHIARQALLGNLASSLGERGQHVEAERLWRQAVAEADNMDPRNKAWMYNNLGQTLLHAERYREALVALDQSDSLNKVSGSALDLAIELAEIRADILDSIGDVHGAYQWIKHARDLQDTLFERSMNEQLLELETSFGTRLKEEEIQRLDAENKEKAERLHAKNLQLYGSLAFALLLLFAIVLVWRNLRQKRNYSTVLERLNVELNERKDHIEEIIRLLQLKVLRTQMNPHFIYNSLNAIHNLVNKGETVSASAYLDGFARLLRMVLDHSLKELVPLEDELAFLRQYIKLEALRFADGFVHTVDAEPNLLDAMDEILVPSLIIQPFVENAIWHGLASKQGDKKLTVRFVEKEGKLICTVEDNGVGRQAAPQREHPDGSASIGLQLTSERLQLLSYSLGGSGRVTFTDLMDACEPQGTRVEVVLNENL
ncbi:MAG: histidine kinase [Flavobacteriales bacterium]|nr:histidine kinase [Flavobacteriales bacterium]